jgi:hypothetical protein
LVIVKDHDPESSVSEWKLQKEIPLSITQTVVTKPCFCLAGQLVTEASAKCRLAEQ